eukprot:scaffold2501_cov174-Amphora_coffeaeformis.AAC.8
MEAGASKKDGSKVVQLLAATPVKMQNSNSLVKREAVGSKPMLTPLFDRFISPKIPTPSALLVPYHTIASIVDKGESF